MNTPQPHVDDIKLAASIAEDIILTKIFDDPFTELPPRLAQIISEHVQPLRLSNEALRERVRELEDTQSPCYDAKALHDRVSYWAEDSQGGAEGKYGSRPQGEPIDYWRGRSSALHEVLAFIPNSDNKKLTAASEVIEKCERALKEIASMSHTFRATLPHELNEKHAQQALAAIKEWKNQ